MTILAADSVSGFFHEVVCDAKRARGVDVTDGATTYLVGLLADFAKPGSLAQASMERPLAFLLDEALHTPERGERFEKLRYLGDGVLYACGFFADHFEARGVDQRYLCGIGTTAYGAASSMLLRGAPQKEEDRPDVFGELSAKFEGLVTIVAEVADLTVAKAATGSRGVLRLYERWLKTGSDRLAQELGAHGLVPMRTGSGGKGTLQ